MRLSTCFVNYGKWNEYAPLFHLMSLSCLSAVYFLISGERVAADASSVSSFRTWKINQQIQEPGQLLFTGTSWCHEVNIHLIPLAGHFKQYLRRSRKRCTYLRISRSIFPSELAKQFPYSGRAGMKKKISLKVIERENEWIIIIMLPLHLFAEIDHQKRI